MKKPFKRYRGGGGTLSTMGANYRTSPGLGAFALLILMFSVIVPMLASYRYKLPVQYLLGVYGVFCLAYGYLLNQSQLPVDASGKVLKNDQGEPIGNAWYNSFTNLGLMSLLIPAALFSLCYFYKHDSPFLPASCGLIGALVLVNLGGNNTITNALSFLLAAAASGTLITLTVQQSYIQTKGGKKRTGCSVGGGGALDNGSDDDDDDNDNQS